MPFLLPMAPIVGWLINQLGGLTHNLETVLLEFVLLGRIPGTPLFIQFEMLLAGIIIAVFTATVLLVFRSPAPRH